MQPRPTAESKTASPSARRCLYREDPGVLKYEYVRPIVEALANARNRRDLEAIMAHYSEDVEMQGPTIVNRWGRSDGNLHGKDEVRTHFSLGLKLAPDLHFEVEDVLLGPDGYSVMYRRENGNRVVDVVHLDHQGQASRVEYFLSGFQP
jgi:hypothetical protein